jgi:hypothetical protein
MPPDALTEARGYSAEFGVALSNHAAMVLLAHRRLGGTEAEARRFLDAYIRANPLVPIAPAAIAIDAARWTEHLGNRDAEAAYRAFFRAELQRIGSARALTRLYLPRLLPGIAASALHALMRLAYAQDSDDAAEVAESLGYWAATYLPLGEGVGAPPITEEPLEVLVRIAGIPRLAALTFEDGLLWHAMRDTAALPEFAPVHDWLAIGPDTLRRIARDALLVMAATMEFCALHALTGTHWLRLLLPVLDPPDQQRAIRYYWQAIASVYPKMHFPLPLGAAEAERQRQLPAPSWEAIAEAARASSDEHDISLAWSARAEQQQWGDPLYRVVAARRLGLMVV